MHFKPLHDWLLVKEIDQSTMHGTIIRPDYEGLSHPVLYGEVLASGPGLRTKKGVKRNTVQTGDKVAFDRRKRELWDLDLDGDGIREPYLGLRERDVLFVTDFAR